MISLIAVRRKFPRKKESSNLPFFFTPFPLAGHEYIVKPCIYKKLRWERLWPTVCTCFGVHMILTSLSNLPETMGLFLIGLVLILSGIVLRRVFLTLGTGVPAPGQNFESKEQSLK